MATKPIEDRSWTEPESAASVENPPVPPYNNITQTQSGHSLEMDDTPTRERVRLQHRTGTFIEMHPNGDEVHKVYGDGYEITIKNKNVLIKGHCNITIEGDSILDIKGDKIERVAGDYNLQVNGSYNVYGKKEINLATTGDFTLGAGSTVGGGSIYMTTADAVIISGDVTVAGDFIADLITSTSRVDAATGVNAGPLGFVSLTGGLSIGIPVAVPTQINCSGIINASIAVNSLGVVSAGTIVTAPTGTFGLMTDTINTGIFSRHVHFVPRGPGISSPTKTPMV
jgi:hypothetical protein